MDSVLTLQIPIRIITFDIDCRRFDTSFISVLVVGNRNLISICLCPTSVHTIQHGCPVLTFCSTGTWIDLQYTTHLVGLIPKHIAELQVLNQLDCLGIIGIQLFFRDDSFFHIFISQLNLIGSRLHIVIQFDPFLQVFHFLHLSFSPFGIFPESRILCT